MLRESAGPRAWVDLALQKMDMATKQLANIGTACCSEDLEKVKDFISELLWDKVTVSLSDN
jgi:hypothetical protein